MDVRPDPVIACRQTLAKSILAHAYCAFRLRGLGTTVQMLKNVCRVDKDATDLIDEAVRTR
jgi:hypothetical protein